MARGIIQPVYLNLAELTKGDPKLGRLELTLNQWCEIPTSRENALGGELSLQVVPGINFQVDLRYDGSIQTFDDLKSGSKQASYPPKNPLFDSEFLQIVSPGHYRFQSAYSPLGFHPGKLSQAVGLTGTDPNIKARRKEVRFKVIDGIIRGRDNLELILDDLLKFVIEKSNGTINEEDDYYDFLSRYQELEDTGTFSGHCKEISTITAGLLNALGLRTKILSAFVYEKVHDKSEPRIGHSITEVHVPVNQDAGFWLLVDPALGNVYNSQRFLNGDDIYMFTSAPLPEFSGSSKTAKIRIKYV